jgi:hypothetical protein
MIDTPTDAASATQPVSNYCVLNPLAKGTQVSGISNGNLKITGWGGVRGDGVIGTLKFPSTGKFKFEVTSSTTWTGFQPGIYNLISGTNGSVTNYLTSGASDVGSYGFYLGSGNLGKTVAGVNTSNVVSSVTWAANDTLTVIYDATNGTLELKKNNSSLYTITGIPAGNFYPYGGYAGGSTGTPEFNFGQIPFTYTDAGCNALCTSNITAPADASKWFYGGSPDFVWIKDRTSAYSHSMNDSVRGWELTVRSDVAGGEISVPDVSDVNKFGMTLIGDTNYRVNKASDNYVYWAWKAGGSSPTTIAVNQYSANTPNIASNVSVSTTSGFSIVTYTYDSSKTNVIGHGLNVTPSMIFMRDRATATGFNWDVYHASLGYSYRLILNSTSGQTTTYWAAAPTSQAFSVSSAAYTNGEPIVAYCWAAIPGFSAFGSYTGNGSADGPFVYCGFRPRWIMAKRTDSTGNWYLFDTTRASSNEILVRLNPDISNAESTDANNMDALSNGFKLRNAGLDRNASGGTYIYAAFAENPFNVALAR